MTNNKGFFQPQASLATKLLMAAAVVSLSSCVAHSGSLIEPSTTSTTKKKPTLKADGIVGAFRAASLPTTPTAKLGGFCTPESDEGCVSRASTTSVIVSIYDNEADAIEAQKWASDPNMGSPEPALRDGRVVLDWGPIGYDHPDLTTREKYLAALHSYISSLETQ